MKKQHNVALIGCSVAGIGTIHLQGITEHSGNLIAICDPDKEALRIQGERFGVPENRRYTDWHDLLDLEGLTEIVVATPDQLHRDISLAFLAKGIHVMCEKPLALSREEVTDIVKASKAAKAKFMVGQICHYAPAFKKTKEIIDSGLIGDLYFVESEYAHDYLQFFIQNPGSEYWRNDPRRNGVVGGGIHAVDLLRWYAGDPTEVFSYGTHKLLPMVSYDDSNVALLKFPNGVMGKVFVSTAVKRNYTMRTVIYGTKGTVICDNTSDYLTLFTTNEDGTLRYPDGEKIAVDVSSHNAGAEYDDFRRIIDEDLHGVMDAEMGAKSLAVCFAIIASSKSGKPEAPDYDFTR